LAEKYSKTFATERVASYRMYGYNNNNKRIFKEPDRPHREWDGQYRLLEWCIILYYYFFFFLLSSFLFGNVSAHTVLCMVLIHIYDVISAFNASIFITIIIIIIIITH